MSSKVEFAKFFWSAENIREHFSVYIQPRILVYFELNGIFLLIIISLILFAFKIAFNSLELPEMVDGLYTTFPGMSEITKDK